MVRFRGERPSSGLQTREGKALGTLPKFTEWLKHAGWCGRLASFAHHPGSRGCHLRTGKGSPEGFKPEAPGATASRYTCSGIRTLAGVTPEVLLGKAIFQKVSENMGWLESVNNSEKEMLAGAVTG